MRICMLGWYGTETIGDRAIFAGLLTLFLSQKDISISLGSLYPFYSQRMLLEDKELYNKLIGRYVDIELFDSTNKQCLKYNIAKSDIVVVAGGPLMDIDEMYMLKYAFQYAKKNNKYCMIAGCGVGPIFQDKYKKILLNIINLSDLVILRDNVSRQSLLSIADEFAVTLNTKSITVAIDPAAICAYRYKKIVSNHVKRQYVAINFRDFPMEYTKDKLIVKENINNLIVDLLTKITREFSTEIRLIPMHYFCVGNDDRYFLNSLAMRSGLSNVYVQNKPLSLQHTMDVYYEAYVGIGMRFHSIVLQTVLNGSNYIIDYTESKKGKIIGFLNDIDKKGFYNDRYVNLQDKNNIFNITDNNKRLDVSAIDEYCDYGIRVYNKLIKKVI